MAEQSEISWTDATFNPWIGCTRVSPACDRCYAARDNERRKWVEGWGAGVPRRRTKTWGDPLKWNRLCTKWPFCTRTASAAQKVSWIGASAVVAWVLSIFLGHGSAMAAIPRWIPPSAKFIVGAVSPLAENKLMHLFKVAHELIGSRVSFSECVDVFDAAPNISLMSGTTRGDEIGKSIRKTGYAGSVKMTRGDDGRGRRNGACTQRKYNIVRFFRPNNSFDLYNGQIRWGFPVVFNNDLDGPRSGVTIVGIGPRKLSNFDKDVWAQFASPIAHHYNNGDSQNDGLNQRSGGNQVGREFGSVIRRRFLLFLTAGLSGLGLSILAGGNLDNDWGLVRAALFGIGMLCCLGSIGLIWASQFPATWGWLL